MTWLVGLSGQVQIKHWFSIFHQSWEDSYNSSLFIWILSLHNSYQDQKIQSWKKTLLLWCFQTHFANQRGLDQNLNFVYLSKTLWALYSFKSLSYVWFVPLQTWLSGNDSLNTKKGRTSLLERSSSLRKIVRRVKSIRNVNSATQEAWEHLENI